MGMVLKAEHQRMKRIVALKVMSQAGMKSPDAVQRFHREVKAAAILRSRALSHVVEFYGAWFVKNVHGASRVRRVPTEE